MPLVSLLYSFSSEKQTKEIFSEEKTQKQTVFLMRFLK